MKSAAALDTCPERSEFAERVLREATRRGFPDASRCVVLGDGSAWIWNTAKELFPQAIQILDRFHAKKHLSKVGKAIYGDSEQSKKWIQRHYDELDKGRMKSLLKALDRHAPKYEEALECADYTSAAEASPEAQLRKLRTERRRTFRLCLRSLAGDFNRVQRSIKILLVQAPDDRPDLAAELAMQRVTFYRNLLLVEGWLSLHACGFDRMPAIDLLEPLQAIQAQLRQLAAGQSVATGANA